MKAKASKDLHDLLKWVLEYGDINMEICGDNILMDPLMSGAGFTPENVAISNECSVLSTIHSAKYHACQEIAEHIRSVIATINPTTAKNALSGGAV